ncbi:MAG: Uma2 family endonuclease [Chloroflexota bacterium]|nr:Uma2 family endonuclease [Chloroflexota bacterium]
MSQQTITTPELAERRLKMTYDEFLAWADEDIHAEWVDGEVTVFVPPSIRHQRLVSLLHYLLGLYADLRNLGEVLVAPVEMRLEPRGSSREPDLLFVAKANASRLSAARLDGPADLVVELVSDSSVARDRADKFYEYQEAGIGEYWVIDPRPGKERVDLYALTAEGRYQAILPDADGRYHSVALPGFWMRAEWLWQDPLPKPLVLLQEIAAETMRAALGSDAGS